MLGKWPSFADLLITISTGRLRILPMHSHHWGQLRSWNSTLHPSAACSKYLVTCLLFSCKVEIYEVLNRNFRLLKQTSLSMGFPKRDFQWILKANRDPNIKINRFFTHFHRVLAGCKDRLQKPEKTAPPKPHAFPKPKHAKELQSLRSQFIEEDKPQWWTRWPDTGDLLYKRDYATQLYRDHKKLL